jgi:hypothetical protein
MSILMSMGALLLLCFASSTLFAQDIDPAVTNLRVIVKGKFPPTKAVIEFVGTIKNIGTKDFKSGTGQQSIRFYEKTKSGKPVVVFEKAFTSLKAGETIFCTYSRKWDLKAKNQPNVTVQIDYDPDIYADGNPANDDRNQDNNKSTVGYTTINVFVGKALGVKPPPEPPPGKDEDRLGSALLAPVSGPCLVAPLTTRTGFCNELLAGAR